MPEWMPIPDYEDCYEVSDVGSVRRTSTRSGKLACRPCKPTWSRGYARFVLCRNGETRTITAHKLVWISFVGPIPQGMQINHKNGVKGDNSIANLELCTPSENTLHAFRVLGRSPCINPNRGSSNGRAKLVGRDIPRIRSLYSDGMSQQKIADMFGVDQTSISRIISGKGWLTY